MTNFVLATLYLLVILFIGFQLILSPMRLLGKLLINGLVGLVSLLLVNYLSYRFGLVLPINIMTVAIAGFLGIPGILGLIVWQIFL
jgi:inhibitor of the pro-sigma K processing machinery